MKYIPRPLLKSTEDALDHIAMINAKSSEGINWAITLKNDSKLIGIIGFTG
jgi:ribosomal-protein-alanine N-acetyltransferase